MAESGDFLIPLQEGAFGESHLLGELVELVTGRIAGRTSSAEITIFKSLGLAVEDVAVLRHTRQQALAAGRAGCMIRVAQSFNHFARGGASTGG